MVVKASKKGRVALSLITTLALFAGACEPGDEEVPVGIKQCVGKDGAIIDDKFCATLEEHDHNYQVVPSYYPYMWYYGGVNSGGYASGGSYTPAPSTAYRAPSAPSTAPATIPGTGRSVTVTSPPSGGSIGKGSAPSIGSSARGGFGGSASSGGSGLS